MAEAVIAYALVWLWIARRLEGVAASIGALARAVHRRADADRGVSACRARRRSRCSTLSHVINLSLILWLSWQRAMAVGRRSPRSCRRGSRRWSWHDGHREPGAVDAGAGARDGALRRVRGRIRSSSAAARANRAIRISRRSPAASSSSSRRGCALLQGGLSSIVGVVPVVEGVVLALLLRALLRIEPRGGAISARLALVAGSALAFATVAIPLQLQQQWITIGWALEGAALAWLYRRIPHRGLLYWAMALLSVVFVRLALNPESSSTSRAACASSTGISTRI